MSDSMAPGGSGTGKEVRQETSGNRSEIRWVVVATTAGITSAQIIAGRLHAEGIPARTWQESAGQATGLVVGALGTGHVVVPEEYAAAARQVLEDLDTLSAAEE